MNVYFSTENIPFEIQIFSFTPQFFGHFFVQQKCPFCPLRVEVLKTRNAKHRKMDL